MQSPEEVYQKYAKSVYKYLMSLVHNRDLAEELTQETFYQAIRCIDHYDHSCKMSTWLCGIAKRQYYKYLRESPPHETLNDTDQLSPAADSAEKEYLDSMQHMELLKALHALPEPFKEVMYLRLFGNLSFREIGDIMGQNENWARVNYYRGKNKLKKEWSIDE